MEIDNNENQNIISSTEIVKLSNDISPTQIINQSVEEIKLNTINKTSKDIENIDINNSSSDISPTQIVNSSNDVSPTQIIQSSEVITNKNTTSKDIYINTTNNNGQYVMKCKIPTIDKQINSLMKLIGCGQNDNGNWIIDNDIDNKSLKNILDILNEKITIKNNRVNNEFIDDNVIYDSDEEIINEGKKNLILEEKEKRIQKEKEKELEEDTESETDTEPETTLLKGYDSDAATDDEENKIEV